MSEPEAANDPRRWLRYAVDDLGSAEALLQVPAVSPRNTCYLAQQAAEKALKAVLVFLSRDVPRTHDLNLVLNLIPGDWLGERAGLKVTLLSTWATFPRYPGDWPEASISDAQDAVTAARAVVEQVLEDFEQRGVKREDLGG